jgi:hypothetical protein
MVTRLERADVGEDFSSLTALGYRARAVCRCRVA